MQKTKKVIIEPLTDNPAEWAEYNCAVAESEKKLAHRERTMKMWKYLYSASLWIIAALSLLFSILNYFKN